MSRAIPVAGLVLAFLLCGCDGEQWFNARIAEADRLSPSAIAALLFGGGFVSEDLTCISAGMLAAKGILPTALAMLACTLGVWTSDSLLFFWGWIGRRGLLERRPLNWLVKPAQLQRSARLFERHGAKLLILSRFMPGSRVAIYVAAGALRYPYRWFALWMGIAASLWAPTMVWLSMKLGGALVTWLEAYEKIAWFAMPAAILLVWLVMKGFEKLVSKKSHLMEEEGTK